MSDKQRISELEALLSEARDALARLSRDAADLSAQVHGFVNTALPRALVACEHSSGQDWQPIETAPSAMRALFWVTPKTEDDPHYVDTCGNPILSDTAPSIQLCSKSAWSSLMKATHWMPLPAPPHTGQQGRETAAEATGSDERNEVLEEAAKVCENITDPYCRDFDRGHFAEAIRALKTCKQGPSIRRIG